MMNARNATLIVMLLAAVAGCESASSGGRKLHADLPSQPGIAASAEEVRPLKVGEAAATGVVRKPGGETVSVASLYSGKPTVLIFYRGAWCPYCTEHLKGLIDAEPKLIEMGFQVLAVSPDKPSILLAASREHGYAYQLLSDSDMSLAKSFGLAFKVDDATIEKYKGYGIDLERDSGFDHHLLPVPAVYIIDRDMVIQFAHWDPNYKKRLPMDELLAAAQRAVK